MDRREDGCLVDGWLDRQKDVRMDRMVVEGCKNG